MAEAVSEALETLQRQIDNLRDDLHGRIDKLVDEINDIPHNLCFRLKSLEDRLASKPDAARDRRTWLCPECGAVLGEESDG